MHLTWRLPLQPIQRSCVPTEHTTVTHGHAEGQAHHLKSLILYKDRSCYTLTL